MTTLDRHHAVVTGGGRGIGAAIAHELAAMGASITLLGRSLDHLERSAAHLVARFSARVHTVQCDVSDADSVAEAFATARDVLGDVHILVNNAGQAESAPFAETTREVWDRMLAVNLTGHFLCTSQVLPAMIASRDGRIVNIASTAGLKGYSHTAAYSAAKHGVVGLTRALAAETAKLGITVNAVCPGYTDTDMARSAENNLVQKRGKTAEEARLMIARTIPRGSIIRPEEVAAAVGWLCSPRASAITGQAIVVAGGEVM